MSSLGRGQLCQHRPRNGRRGSSLLELLVALPLLALLAAIAAGLLLTMHRVAQRTDASLTASHELRHAAAVLSAELRALRSSELQSWTDTTLEIRTMVGAGLVCSGRGPLDRVELLPTDRADAAHTHWRSALQAGDDAQLFLATTDSMLAPMAYSAVVRTQNSSRACRGSSLLDSSAAPAAPTLQLVLAMPLPSVPAVGSPVRVTRAIRYELYRSGGRPFLGRRERNGLGWDVLQPVAGPLLNAQSRGLHIDVRDRSDVPVHLGDTTAALVRIELRAAPTVTPRAGSSRLSLPDSIAVVIALRPGSPQ